MRNTSFGVADPSTRIGDIFGLFPDILSEFCDFFLQSVDLISVGRRRHFMQPF